MTVGHRKLGIGEERALARTIASLDREVRARLVRIPEAAALLAGRTRSRDAERDRIAAALEAVERGPHPGRVEAARARWDEAERLRWTLALSGTRVVRLEARRLAANRILGEEDLRQEGWLGLLAAARRFDPDRAIRFGTYARWWVRAAMTRAINHARTVRLSGSASEQLRNLRKQIWHLESRRGADWTLSEAAEAVGLDGALAKVLLESGSPVPLDAPADDEVPFELVDEGAPPDDLLAERQQREWVGRVLQARIAPREQALVARRFGLDGGEPGSLREVAAVLGLSRTRVSQLESSTIATLREALTPICCT